MLARTLEWLTRRPGVRRKAGDLYGKVVAAARRPGFYGGERVSDTPEGRFELVALHLFLVVEKIKASGSGGDALAQNVIEAFVTDMDDCMREMGVGDLTVPKRVKRAAAVFYDRAGAYRAALSLPVQKAGADPLAEVVARTILSRPAAAPFVAVLAGYIRASHQALACVVDEALAAGQFEFAAAPAPGGRDA